MKINKRFKRSIKNNISFYISASLLTAMSVLLLVTMYTGATMIDQGFKTIFKEGNVENAQFTTYTPIDEEGINTIENTYNTELEEIHYVDISEESYTLRVFAPTDKINKYKLLEGEDISLDNEILLNRDFAKANKILVGDNLAVSGKEFTVVGLAVRPDYLYAQKNNTDFYLDKALFGQVTMGKTAFDELEHTQSYYTIVYNENNNAKVRQYIYENYFLLSYLSAESNNRISMAMKVGDVFKIMIGMVMPIMFAMISVIVAMVLNRKIKKEQKQIGTLVALGYRKREMIRHYAIYAAIPGVIGSVIGIILGIIFLKPVCLFFATDYEQINYDIKLYWTALVISILTPALLYMLTSVFTVARMLRKNTVLLLTGNADGEKERKNRFLGKRKSHFLAETRLSFRNKFQFRALLKHKSRTFVVIMGMFVGGFVCALGLIMIDSCNYLIDKGLDAAGNYEYQYYLNTIETAELEAGEPMLSVRFEVPGQDSLFTLSGLVEKPNYLKLNTKSGKEIEYGKYYMTSNAAALYGVKAGDAFTFINILSIEEYTVTVTDIIDDNTQSVLYTSRSNVAGLLGVSEDGYNAIMSDTKLSLDKDKIYLENSKENLKAQLKFTIKMTMGIIYIILVFGSILCIITVYLTVNMLIEENRVNISMLEVLGYRKSEINRLVLNTNHILVPISFVLSIWLSVKLCEKLFEAFIAELNIYIEPTITIPSMLICLLILMISYLTSLTMLKRKVYRIDMVESLKDNRE